MNEPQFYEFVRVRGVYTDDGALKEVEFSYTAKHERQVFMTMAPDMATDLGLHFPNMKPVAWIVLKTYIAAAKGAILCQK